MVQEPKKDTDIETTLKLVVKLLRLILSFIVIAVFGFSLYIYQSNTVSNKLANKEASNSKADSSAFWQAANINSITDAKQKELVVYGKELIVHTAQYLGPKGSVLQITNGMNCQNCHLEAGTKIWGNNYGAVFATYPKYRARSGKVEDIYKRINDCIERSLNGTSLSLESKEMQAIKAYIEFI